MNIRLLDGSIGQELVSRAGDEPTPLWSTEVMLSQPELLEQVHSDYFKAGATIATTNSYAVLRDRLAPEGLEDCAEELWKAAVDSACAARDAHGSGQIAASIGPLVASYRPEKCPPVEEAARIYAEVVSNLQPRADLLLAETMSSVDQADGALMAACRSGKPVWLAVTVDDQDGTRLRSGEPLADLGPMLERHQLEAVLINCSLPEVISDALGVISAFGLPFGAYANGFTGIGDDFLEDRPTVAALEARHDLTPERYAEFAMHWVEQGATIVGGCCEVGPAHISELAKQLCNAGHTIV